MVGPRLRFGALVWLIGSLVLAALTLGSATGLASMKGWPLDAKVFMAIIHLGVLLWSLAGTWGCAFVLFGRETLILDDSSVFLQWQIGAWKGRRTFPAAECQNFRINARESSVASSVSIAIEAMFALSSG